MAVLLYFVQTAMLEVGSIHSILSWMDFVNFNLATTTSSCLAPLTPYQQVLLNLLTPIILLVELFIIAIIHLFLHSIARLRVSSDSHSNSVSTLHNPELFDHTDTASSSTKLQQRVFNNLAQPFEWNKYARAVIAILLATYTQVHKYAD